MTIPSDVWPDGVVAHLAYGGFGAWVHLEFPCKSGGDFVTWSEAIDDEFGLPPGTITIRPSAAEDELRRVTEQWCIESDYVPDDDQDNRQPIERRLHSFYIHSANQLHALRAERDQLRAELANRSYGDARDMAESLFLYIRHGDEQHQAWLRKEAIAWASQWIGVDASIVEQPPIEPIPGTTAGLAKLTIRGG